MARDEEEPGRFAAELELILTRHVEITRELAEQDHRIGRPITTDIVDDGIRDVAAAVKAWGNAALADAYLRAWEVVKSCTQALRTHGARVLEMDPTGKPRWRAEPRTDTERAEWDAAQEAFGDAEEHFERVAADVRAFCKGLDQKGGA